MESSLLLPSVEFDPINHTYRVNGEIYPSVTTVLADAGIVQKSKYPEGAADRGKDIHKMLQLYDENDLDYGSVTDEQSKHLERWSEARGRIGFSHPRHELIVFHQPYRYAGTIDAVDEDRIVEFKSGRKERWHVLQVLAYRMAYEKYFGVKVKASYIVYTKPDIEDYLVEVEQDDYLEEIFLSALNVSDWKSNGKSKRKSRDPEYDE